VRKDGAIGMEQLRVGQGAKGKEGSGGRIDVGRRPKEEPLAGAQATGGTEIGRAEGVEGKRVNRTGVSWSGGGNGKGKVLGPRGEGRGGLGPDRRKGNQRKGE